MDAKITYHCVSIIRFVETHQQVNVGNFSCTNDEMCTQLPSAFKNIIQYHLQAVFSKKRFQTPLKPFTSGYKLEDYIIGNQIGKGSNAAVYEAAAPFAPLKGTKSSLVQLKDDEDEREATRSLSCCALRNFPLAIKMMWNFGVGVLHTEFWL